MVLNTDLEPETELARLIITARKPQDRLPADSGERPRCTSSRVVPQRCAVMLRAGDATGPCQACLGPGLAKPFLLALRLCG